MEDGVSKLPREILRQGWGAMPHENRGAVVENPGLRHWISNGFDLKELIDALRSSISPNSWDEVGGLGSVREFRNALVVRQTQEIHIQIETVIQGLRDAKRRQDEQAPLKPHNPEELKRVVYDLEPYSYPVDQLCDLIPELISPESWKAAGGKGTLHVQPTALIITQTPAVHKEIVKLLYEVVLRQRLE
jgi:hypothetical protein